VYTASYGHTSVALTQFDFTASGSGRLCLF